MRRVLIFVGTLLVVISLMVNITSAQSFKGHPAMLQEVQAPGIEKLAVQKLNEAKPATPFLGRMGNVYLVPFLDKNNNVIFSLRIDAQTGDVLELGKRPSSIASTGKPKISAKQVSDKVEGIHKKHCLRIGKIYKNPRGIYFIEVKCEKGKILAMLKSDGKEMW